MGTPEWSRRVRIPPRGLIYILKIMEKFIKFLEDNNAWENFERNFIEQERDVKEYKRDCKTLTFKLRIHVVKDKRRTRILV